MTLIFTFVSAREFFSVTIHFHIFPLLALLAAQFEWTVGIFWFYPYSLEKRKNKKSSIFSVLQLYVPYTAFYLSSLDVVDYLMLKTQRGR